MSILSDFEKQIRETTSTADLFSLLASLFVTDNAIAPYKRTSSDYGLKATGKRTREKINEQCKEILARVNSPEQLTPEDTAVLLQYSGRGGLTENSQYEYYTPTHVAEGVWDALKAQGFVNGNVLDPCCGAGIFSGTKPEGVIITGNDLDPTGSKVAALLNPEDHITEQPFERVVMNTQDDTFDSCVGNVPFGNARGASMHEDPAYKSEKLIERYFLLRILDKIKPGGLACLVCPTNIVGNKGRKWEEFRIAVSKKAEFLGAHKLPSKTFAAQGTDTVVDVVVLKKHSRDFLNRVEEIPFETLKSANVVWDEFIKGRYWEGEGRKFIMGKYIPKTPGDRYSRDVVDGDVDNAGLKMKLAQKFDSRIDWAALNAAEAIVRAYGEGDRRSISGTMYEMRNGVWEKVVENITETTIDKAKYGVGTMEELRSLLSTNEGALNVSLDNAFAVFKAFPELMTAQQKAAVQFAVGQPRDEYREQIYRGSLIGSMIAKMGVDEEGGEDVTARRAALQERVVAEIEKYGHPANNSGLCLMGENSRAFGMFRNAVDSEGNFSDLLSGKLSKTGSHGYNENSIGDIVTHLFVQEDMTDITFEDVKSVYKGTRKIENLGDLADVEEIAITPEGTIMPRGRYCSGEVVPKMTACLEAISNTDDERLKAKFRKQIEEMDSKMVKTATEDIVFGLRDKWYPRKYIVDFLRENGYPDARYGHYGMVETEDYLGRPELREQFIDDPEGTDDDSYFVNIGDAYFAGQLEKYMNGANVTSNTKEKIEEYRDEVARLEQSFNVWMQQHMDVGELTAIYNQRFNGFVQFDYEESSLGMDEILSGEIKPHTYQNAEVRRLSDQGAGICGFGTGLGKSFTALALAGHNYLKGRSSRTCVIVPSAVLENWYHEARMFYSESYMRSNVFFVGLEPKLDKEGNIVRKPILDEHGQPRKTKGGSTMMQDDVRFANSPQDIYEAMWKIPQSNYSLVVMTKEKFESIPLRPETKRAYTSDMVSRHLLSEKQAEKASDAKAKAGRKVSYQDDKDALNLEARFSNEGRAKKKELPYLEDMGFDSIITDESHFFKNSLEAGKNSQGIAYVPSPRVSNIAMDMAMKSHYIRSKNNGRGVYGLSATPVTNSPIEIFNMLSLVTSPDEFKRFGVNTVDDFVNIFGDVQDIMKQSVSGEVRSTLGLVGFKNLDGLRNLFKKYVNVKTVDDVGNEIHVPNAEEHEEEVEISDIQRTIYDSLRARAKALMGKRGSDKGGDSIFRIMREMDRLTTDIDLYNKTMTFVFPAKYAADVKVMIGDLPTHVKVKQIDEETGATETVEVEFQPEMQDDGETVRLVVHELMEENVLNEIGKHRIALDEVAHPVTPKYAKMIENLKKHFEANGKQIVFTEEKTQHRKLRRIIVHHLPVTEDQIGIINAEEAAGNKLDKISKSYNSGAIKIVIANKKAEVGVNLQKGTTAIHHLTLPWTPASINQRNGRGVRQGNKVDTVAVYYYYGKGTFDSYRKQTLQAKANWINNILHGTETSMENGDHSSMDEIAIMFADNPEEAKRLRAEMLAAEEKKREDSRRLAYMNSLQRLVSINANLSTLDERKETERADLEAKIAETERKLTNAETRADREKADLGMVQDSTKRAIENHKRSLSNQKARLNGLDAAFEKVRTNLTSQKNMATGILRAAEKDGKLPFNGTLIDHPENCVVSVSGALYAVGDVLEFENGTIVEITGVDPASRDITVKTIVKFGYGHGHGWNDTIPTAKLNVKKVSYSKDELALKQIMAKGVNYTEILESGISKQAFLDNIANINVKTYNGAVIRRNGKFTIISQWSSLDKGDEILYPEPNDPTFRKNCMTAWVEEQSNGHTNLMDNLMESLFGEGWEEEAMSYGKKATSEEIASILKSTYAKMEMEYADKDSLLRVLSHPWHRELEIKALGEFSREGFLNREDLSGLAKMYVEAKVKELEKTIADEQAEAERRKAEALKAHPDYKEIPSEIAEKFEKIGITVKVNTKEFGSKDGRRYVEHAPFSRYLFHDANGIGGILYRTKEIIKARYSAKFIKEWNEFGGAWWHMSSTYDLEDIYSIMAYQA